MDFEPGDEVQWKKVHAPLGHSTRTGIVKRLMPADGNWTDEDHVLIRLDRPFDNGGVWLALAVAPVSECTLLRRASVFERLALIEPED